MILLISGISIVSAQNNFHSSKHKVSFEGLNGDFNVNFKGNIKVTDNDKGIQSISQGGFLEIEKKTFGNNRRLNIYPNSSGTLVYEYYEGLTKKNFEPEGRIWMQEILPDIIRNTGIDVEGRVQRFYSKGGINSILAEIKAIESDFVAANYYRVLILQQKLTDSEYKLAIIALSRTISSDFEKSNVFIAASDIYENENRLTEAYLTSVSSISSDFEKSRVLKNLDIQKLNETQLSYYLNTTNTISSDFEKSNVIKFIVNRTNLPASTILLAIKATEIINSDFEKSSCLIQILSKTTDDKSLVEIFNAVENMNSDFEKSNVLKKSVSKLKTTTPLLDAFFNALNSMNSDFEQGSVLQAVSASNLSGDELTSRIFKSAGKIASDFEKANVLKSAARNFKQGSTVYEDFFNAAKTINSDFELSGVLKSLIINSNIDEPLTLMILNSTTSISSDFEKANVLKLLAGKMPKTDKVKEEFIKAAKTINSSTEFGDLMKAVF